MAYFIFKIIRSEVRILLWKQTFFQVVAYIVNRNHKIDWMLTAPKHKIVFLIEKRSADNAIIHIYQYSHKILEIEDQIKFDIKRVQLFSITFDINSAYTFNDYNSGLQFLIVCNQNILQHISENHCEYFKWHDDVIDSAAILERSELFAPRGVRELNDSIKQISITLNDFLIIQGDSSKMVIKILLINTIEDYILIVIIYM